MSESAAIASTEESQARYKAACRVIPGGVSFPAWAFEAAGGVPRFMARGAGAILTDIDGNEYIDYVCGWGSLILGHADERVEAAVCKAAAKGCCLGAPTELETRLAELVIARFGSIDMVCWASSGTEATGSAIRLAQSVTGRDKVVTVRGCHPGQWGPTVDTLAVPFNDAGAATRIMEEHGDQVAAVLVEPVASSMGLILPEDGYLQTLRDLCDRAGALLVFDELTTGLRVSPGGAQALYGVAADLTCLGGVLGGGLPAAAFGGRTELMERVSPAETIQQQAGAPAGNPLAMAAGIATLQALGEPGVYEALEERSAQLAHGIEQAAATAGVPIRQTRVGSMGCVFFTDEVVTDPASSDRCDPERQARYFRVMLQGGVYLAPSRLACYFVSTAHEPEQIERTVQAAQEAFAQIAAEA